jgi:hypothetical protein
LTPLRPRLEPLEDRLAPAARVQVINDLIPVTAFRMPVDVFIDGVLVADDLPAGEGTPFLTVPSGVPVEIVVGNSLFGLASPHGTLTRTFADGETGVVAAVEPLLPPRPPQPLVYTDAGREAASVIGAVDLAVLNGTEAAPPVDVWVVGVGRIADDLPFGTFGGYASIVPGVYTLEVFRADGAIRLGTFELDLSAAGGKAAVLALGGSLLDTIGLTPGFIDPSVVFADGSSTGRLPATAVPEARFAASGGGLTGLFNQTGVQIFGQNLPRQVGMPAVAADVTGDGVPDLIGAHGPELPQVVYAFDGRTGATAFILGNPFEATFTGGVFVAAGDFNDDGFADLVLTPDQGGAGRVRVLSGRDRSVLADFFGIEDVAFRGGARAAVGDVTGDGVPDLIVAAGFGGGPRVAVYDGSDLRPGATPRKVVGDFFVFEDTLRNGVFAAVGDLDADGRADPIFGGGPGGGPRVLAVSGADLTATGDLTPLANFFAGDVNDRGGVRVAAHYLDDDGRADVLTGLSGTGVQVRSFLGRNLSPAAAPPAALEVSPFPAIEGDVVFVG